ncbi:hypothetical protein BT69DRAFT_103398 [Atractiella rhizophila]|nr:hypothetical protein BT69DRAFT_103398 [Atractiella rhizophila]
MTSSTRFKPSIAFNTIFASSSFQNACILTVVTFCEPTMTFFTIPTSMLLSQPQPVPQTSRTRIAFQQTHTFPPQNQVHASRELQRPSRACIHQKGWETLSKKLNMRERSSTGKDEIEHEVIRGGGKRELDDTGCVEAWEGWRIVATDGDEALFVFGI